MTSGAMPALARLSSSIYWQARRLTTQCIMSHLRSGNIIYIPTYNYQNKIINDTCNLLDTKRTHDVQDISGSAIEHK